MPFSPELIIYGLIFIGVLVLVEGVYLTVFGKSISLNSRVNRRLEMLDKGTRREEVLEQLRKEMKQHGETAHHPALFPAGRQGPKGRHRLHPQAADDDDGGPFRVFPSCRPDRRHPDRCCHHRGTCRSIGMGVGGRLFLGVAQGQQASVHARRTTARCHRTDGAQPARGTPLFLGPPDRVQGGRGPAGHRNGCDLGRKPPMAATWARR